MSDSEDDGPVARGALGGRARHPADRQDEDRHRLSEMTFRGLGIWDLGIMTRVGVRKLGEIDGLLREQSSNGLGPAPSAPAYGPGTEGAGIRVYGYAIKNSGLIVAVNH